MRQFVGIDERILERQDISANLDFVEERSYETHYTHCGIEAVEEEALGALGELLGKNIREDLVDTIFSRFCVGK